jgi:hypothetical protein
MSRTSLREISAATDFPSMTVVGDGGVDDYSKAIQGLKDG